MDGPWAALGTALVTSAAATPCIAHLAPALGLIDHPSPRSTHQRPVPRTGGLALAAGLIAGLAVAGILPPLSFTVPAALFFAIGLADDRWRIPAKRKFLLQGVVAAAAVALGWRWVGAGHGPFAAMTFGAITPVMTWLWLMAVLTVVNFIDGIDLITSATACVLLAASAGFGQGPAGGTLAALCAAALLGMAFWNVSPARVFPGDSATHLLGFVIATQPLAADGGRALPWALAAAPLLPGVLDVAGGLIAKARRGVPLSQAHGDHLYQRLTKAGFSHVRVALRYAALVMIAVTLVGWVAPNFGLAPCLVVGFAILGWHRVDGWRRTRALPWSTLDAA